MKALIALRSFNSGQAVLKDIDWQKNRLIDAGYEVEICADGSFAATRLAEKIKKIEGLEGSLLLLNYAEKWESGCALLAGSACKTAVRYFGEYLVSPQEAVLATADLNYCDSESSLEACSAAGIERSRLYLLPVNYDAEYYDGIKADLQYLHGLIDGNINVLIDAAGAGRELMDFAGLAVRKYIKFFEKKIRLLIVDSFSAEENAGENIKEPYGFSGKIVHIGRPTLSRRKAVFLSSHILLLPSDCGRMTERTLEAQYFKMPVLSFGKNAVKNAGVYDCGDCATEELAAAIYTFFHNLDLRVELSGKGSLEYSKHISSNRDELFLGPLKRIG